MDRHPSTASLHSSRHRAVHSRTSDAALFLMKSDSLNVGSSSSASSEHSAHSAARIFMPCLNAWL